MQLFLIHQRRPNRDNCKTVQNERKKQKETEWGWKQESADSIRLSPRASLISESVPSPKIRYLMNFQLDTELTKKKMTNHPEIMGDLWRHCSTHRQWAEIQQTGTDGDFKVWSIENQHTSALQFSWSSIQSCFHSAGFWWSQMWQKRLKLMPTSWCLTLWSILWCLPARFTSLIVLL